MRAYENIWLHIPTMKNILGLAVAAKYRRRRRAAEFRHGPQGCP